MSSKMSIQGQNKHNVMKAPSVMFAFKLLSEVRRRFPGELPCKYFEKPVGFLNGAI